MIGPHISISDRWKIS